MGDQRRRRKTGLLMSKSTIFDVPNDGLDFQDFGSATIAPDVPSGRISPSGAGVQRDDLYAADRQIGSSISGATQPGGFLSLEYYSGWFDGDTRTVLTRCWRTLVGPVLRENYIEEVLAGAPDLYGPFWVPTVLIFSLFLTSSLSTSISAYLAGSSYNYDFTRLGAAVSLVYSYFLGLPCLLWLATKYWAGVSDRSAVDFLGVYGYGSTIWVAVAWLALIPLTPLRLALVAVGTAISLAFLILNVYPVLSLSPNKSAHLLLVAAAVLHLALALTLYVGFFKGGSVTLDGCGVRDTSRQHTRRGTRRGRVRVGVK